MDWWTDTLNKSISQVELRTQASMRLYLIMLHYDENNIETIEYVSKKAKKYLEQIAIYHEPEKLFLKQINDIANTIDKKERKTKFTSLYQQLSQMQLTISGNAINKFIIDWVKSKI